MRASIVVLASLLALAPACNRSRDLDAGPLGEPVIRFAQVVYLLPSSPPVSETFVDSFLPAYAGLQRVDQTPRTIERMTVAARVSTDLRDDAYPVPDREFVETFGRGMTREQGDALQKSTGALVLEFAHPRVEVWRGLRHATALTGAIARATGGLIYDPESREIFGVEEWERRRLSQWDGPIARVLDFTCVHLYQHDDDYLREISLGMAKFGLPDIVMTGVARSHENQALNTINLVSQSLAEGAVPGKGGFLDLDMRAIRHSAFRESQLAAIPRGTGKARLHLVKGNREEGDPENRLVEIASDAYPGPDDHARQMAMFLSLFGADEDKARIIDHDAEVLAASRKAREQLPALRKAFNDGLPPGQMILVKAPFAVPDGRTEWMWVEVTRWNGDAIRGLLMNQPTFIKDLKEGQVVNIEESEIFDYMRRYPDGRQEGNTTAKVLYKER